MKNPHKTRKVRPQQTHVAHVAHVAHMYHSHFLVVFLVYSCPLYFVVVSVCVWTTE